MNNTLTPIQRVLRRAGGSQTEVARLLTKNTDSYYTVNQVAYWVRSGQIPPEHMTAVATAFDMRPEDVCPELFKQYNATRGDRANDQE